VNFSTSNLFSPDNKLSWTCSRFYRKIEENRDIAHQLYLGSLRRSSTYAPSWTAIGIFCAELHPPDDVRASKCFQRAFELDPREGEAGRRLADHFADAREWELVEIIAKRTIEGEGGLEGGLATAVDERVKEAKGRFLVGNVWAWKALGAVELTRSAFAKAINHFQIALRSNSTDIASWLRLSEAYARSGKQAAALKTLARARAIDPDNWLVTFMIGDVQTQLGVHTEAIRCFREILKTRPKELGVLVALARSHLALAREEASAGYHARSEGSLIQSLASVQAILVEKVGFRALAWKHVGDVCLDLARLSFQFDVDMVAKALIPFVKILVAEDPSGHSSVDCVATARQLLSPKPEIDIAFVLRLATCAFTYRRHLLVGDEIASAVASHDIAIALHHLGTDAPTLLETVRQACVKEATAAIRSALRAQPRNEHLWITLGTLSFESSAKLSQHAFVMALEINPKVSNSSQLMILSNANSLTSILEPHRLEQSWLPLSQA
jgi:superkiller protein 3